MPPPKIASAPEPDLVWTAPWQLFLIVLAAFVGLFAATLRLPHDPYARYQHLSHTLQFRAQWGYERVVFDPTPINVAIIGNSRLEASVSAPNLQRALSEKLGHSVYVANLARPQEGRNLQYSIARRLLETRPEVKLIVLSAIEQMPRLGHPAFRDLAEADDIVAAPKLGNLDYANDLAILPYRQLSLFVQTHWADVFGVHRTFDRQGYAGSGLDTTLTFRNPSGTLVDHEHVMPKAFIEQSAHERLAKINQRILPRNLADYEFAIERVYTRKIAELAHAHGVKVVFLAMPIYADRAPIDDAAFYEQFGPIIRPAFVAEDYRNYSDYAHMNRNGSRAVTAWLGDQLAGQGLR